MDRPLIFSAPMILALLAGRKSQTRRIATKSNSTVLGTKWGRGAPWSGLLFDHPMARARTTSTIMDVIAGNDAPYDPHINVPFIHPEDAARGDRWDDDKIMYRVRPIWEIGDRLWVRETWWPYDGLAIVKRDLEGIVYKADGVDMSGHWRSPLFMPRWASRLTLEVTGVKVERLQEINHQDATAEGVDASGPIAINVFHQLWNSIHGADAWDANPWVYAISFKTHKCNIDAMK